jgi:glycosyltransferase involved in cell wall biosynthesis
MRVALLSFHFGEYAYRLANALAKEHDVLLLCDEANLRNEFGGTGPPARRPRLRVETVTHARTAVALMNHARIRRAVADHDPDVVHIQEFSRDYLVSNFRFLSRYPLVVTVHDPVPHRGADRRRMQWSRHRAYDAWLRRNAEIVAVHDNSLIGDLHAVNPQTRSTSVVLPMGPFGPLEEAWQPPPEPKTMLFFGRMHEYKGLDVLVESLQLLAARGITPTVIVAGRGPALAPVRPALQALGCEIHEGYIAREVAIGLFHRAGIVVLPYHEATQSAVAAFASGSGRASIASDVGGLHRFVRPGITGTLVRPGDPDALAAAIDDAMSDAVSIIRMGCEARRLSERDLSWSNVADSTVAAYRTVVG